MTIKLKENDLVNTEKDKLRQLRRKNNGKQTKLGMEDEEA